MNKDKINITISRDTHQWLNSLKLIKEEPFDSVLQRIKNTEHWNSNV